MENVFLFTGENEFTLRQELLRWIREFREKHGEENLSRLSAAGLAPSAFLNEVAAAPFIADRSLVVVDVIPSFAAEEGSAGKRKGAKGSLGMQAVLHEVHPQVIVLFVAPKPDRRLATTKELLECATVRTFAPLQGDALLRWMQEEFRQRGTAAGPEVQTLLLSLVGEDQQVLSQEIEKLSLAAGGQPLTRAHIDALVLPSAEQTIWHLLDLLGEGHPGEAVAYCRQLMRRGESAQGIWAIFLWIVTSFAAVTAAVQEGTTSIQGIMEATGVKFGAARSLLPLARTCRREALCDLLNRVTEADIRLKTGVFKSGGDSEEELAALLDRCLLSFPTR